MLLPLLLLLRLLLLVLLLLLTVNQYLTNHRSELLVARHFSGEHNRRLCVLGMSGGPQLSLVAVGHSFLYHVRMHWKFPKLT